MQELQSASTKHERDGGNVEKLSTDSDPHSFIERECTVCKRKRGGPSRRQQHLEVHMRVRQVDPVTERPSERRE